MGYKTIWVPEKGDEVVYTPHGSLTSTRCVIEEEPLEANHRFTLRNRRTGKIHYAASWEIKNPKDVWGS